MSTAPAQLDERTLILEKIAELDLPPGVKFKRLELGYEWTGEPAWHIYFSMSKSKPYTKARITAFNGLKQSGIDVVIGLQTGKYPFVHLSEAK